MKYLGILLLLVFSATLISGGIHDEPGHECENCEGCCDTTDSDNEVIASCAHCVKHLCCDRIPHGRRD
ncbi:hypothetical protein XENTR_v10015781 [Xenopus tropicalis]|nr:hypothetical protein XENTR_v10015781 [Xenopus tropicalis]